MDKHIRIDYKRIILIVYICLFVFLLAVNYFQKIINAATVSGLTDTNIGLDSTDGTWSAAGTSINGSVTGSSGCFGDSDASASLTIKNTKSIAAVLSFDYTISLNGGTISIAGTSVSSNGSFSREIASNSSITISLKSAKGEKTTSISIANISLIADVNASVTYKTPVNGTYTVDGNEITEQITITKNSSQITALVATPASGYRFYGWHNVTNDSFFAFTSSYSANFDVNITVEPTFIPSNAPVFDVSGKPFIDLNEAISYATSNSKSKIVLVSDGVLQSGDYTIPNGKTLLIPFDVNYTVYEDSPSIVYGKHVNPTAFKTLTMASGANIIIASGGKLCLSGQLCSTGQMGGWNGTPTGPDGRINMQSGSSITVQSGGKLFCWGYIYGNGSVVAQSGSIIHEAFQVKDWRGGTATSNVYEYAFIFSQYYIQNIEVPLTIYAGATEKLYSAVNASSSAYTMGATFVGSGGLFNITSGYFIKDYIESTDRLQVDVYGNVSLSSMTITGLPFIGSISTTDYIMPITSNITINIHSGTTSVSQDIELLPSVEISIDQGAKLVVNSNKSVYLYDNDDWDTYTGSARLYVIGYSVANSTNPIRTAASLVDAKIDVNGEIELTGKMYTSNAGAKIISSGCTGKVTCKTVNSTSATIYEMKGNSTKTAVSFNPAYLNNGNDTYVYTSSADEADDYFRYCQLHSLWEKNGTYYSITFNDCDNNTIVKSACSGDHNVEDFNNIFSTKTNYSLVGWNTLLYGNGTAYSNNPNDSNHVINISANITIYAQWARTMQLNANGGTLGSTTVTIIYKSKQAPTIVNPTNNSSTFAGWVATSSSTSIIINSDGTFVSNISTYTDLSGSWIYSGSNNVLYACWTSTTFTITFYDEDGTTVLYTQENVALGVMPTYAGPTLTKDPTTTHEYEFIGWDPALDYVTGDASYIAVYNPVARKYNIIYLDMGGANFSGTFSGTYPDKHKYGSPTPLVDPSKEGYTFNGWFLNSDCSGSSISTLGATDYTDDITLFASWTILTFYIEFRDQDETPLFSKTYNYNESVTYLGDPIANKNDTNDGVDIFIGWNTDKNATSGNNDLPSATATWVYYAIYYRYDKVTVIFESNGGTAVSTQYIIQLSSEYVVEPSNPSKTENDFIGWYLDSTFETEFDFSQAIVEYYAYIYEKTMILYAKWNPHAFMIIYRDEGNNSFSGVHGSNYPTSHTYGTDTILVSPTKEGYTFNGWFIQSNCSGTEITILGGTDYTDSITLYAKWTINSYTIYYVLNGGDYDITPPNSYTYSTSEQSINIGTATKEGCMGYVSTDVGTINNGILTIFANTTGDITITWTWKIIVNKPAADNTVYTYNGLEQTYQIASNSGYVVTNDKRTDAGSQNVTVTLNSGYIWNTGTEEVLSNYVFTIQKAALIVEANDNSIIYGAAPSANGYTITGFVNNENEGVLTGSVTYSYNYSQYGNVGNYNIIPAGLSSDNYNISYVNGTLTVNPKEVGITWGETGLIYTGSDQAPTATPTGLVNGDTATITVTGGQTNVGSYTATASGISNSNYVLPSVNTTTFNISFRITFASGEHGTGTIADVLIQVNYYTITGSFTPETGYDFNGWSITSGSATVNGNDLTNITNNLTVTATWLIQSFTITWLMDDGSTIDTTTVNYGVVPTYADPSKSQTDEYSYTFTGWDPEPVEVTGVATYTATFSQTARTYPIHFVYGDKTFNTTFTLVNNFIFPLGTNSAFSGTDETNTVKKWTHSELSHQEPGDSVLLTLSYNDKTFNAFVGGFYNIGTDRYYIEPTRDTFANGKVYGLYKINNGTNIKIYYFDETTGILHTDSSIHEFSGDGNYYSIVGGYVDSTEGLIKDSSNINNNYYYKSDKNYFIKSGYNYLSEFNSIGEFKNGYYSFSNGKLTRINVNADSTKFNKTYIDNNVLYYDGIKVPYGLYKDTSNKLHYALYDGNLVNNDSVYIVAEKANSYSTYVEYLCKFNSYKMYNPYRRENVTYAG